MSKKAMVDWYVNDFGETIVNFCLFESISIGSLFDYVSHKTDVIPMPKVELWTMVLPKKGVK